MSLFLYSSRSLLPLLGSALLVPTEAAVVELATRTGKVVSRYRLAHPRECGNLVVAGKTLLSASFDRIDVYGDASDIPTGGSAEAALHRGNRLDRLGDIDGALGEYERALSAPVAPGAKAAPSVRSQVLAAISPVARRAATHTEQIIKD